MKQNLLFSKMKKLSMAFLTMGLATSMHSQAQETVSSNRTGTQDGWYWSFWKDNGNASITLYPGGRYTTQWNGVNNFTAGKGWAVGKADRNICFSGTFNGGTNGYLAVYGWTKNELIEYYVVENYGSWTPPGGTSLGTFSSDGGTYNIYKTQRVNQPSIIGTATFYQYWSVRTTKRSSGTVTFANHVAAWKAKGMNMGSTWDYQIIETEGYQSTGSSDVTISECGNNNNCTTAAPTVKASVSYGVGDQAYALTATGTSLKWYTSETGGTASTTAPTPNTSKAGTTIYYVSQTANNCEGPRASITVTVAEIYKINKISTPITIDGTVDPVWNSASITSASATKLLSGTVSNSSDLSGTFKVLWDNTNLYVLADVNDDTKTNDSDNAYDDDGVEVYVDINNDKATTYGANDVQYTFGWDNGTTVNTLPSGRSTTGITYAAVAKTGGYIVEASIPWSTLQGSPAANQFIGLDFMINDDDDGGTRDAKLSWNASADDAWEDASLFGVGQLKDNVVTSLDDAQYLNGVEIYPNPVTDKLMFTLPVSQAEVSLMAMDGTLVSVTNTTSPQVSIDMTNHEAGIYLLKVVTESGQTMTKKVMKR